MNVAFENSIYIPTGYYVRVAGGMRGGCICRLPISQTKKKSAPLFPHPSPPPKTIMNTVSMAN